MKKTITILLILSLILPFFTYNTLVGKGDEEDAAVLLMALARSNIDNIDSINQLKEMKDIYEDYYDQLDNHAPSDKMKDMIEEQRNATVKVYDRRIDHLRDVRDKRSNQKWLNRFFRFVKNVPKNLGKGLSETVKGLDKSIKLTAKTIVRSIPTSPREAISFIIEHGLTGGSISFKQIFKNIAKTSFQKNLEQQAFIRMAKITKSNQMLSDFLILNDLAGQPLNIDKDFMERFSNYVLEQEAMDEAAEETDNGSSEETADEPAGYEGEGGYDEEESNSANPKKLWQQFIENCNNNEIFWLEMAGEYALIDFQLRVPPEDYYRAYLEEWDYFGYDLEHFVSQSEENLNQRLALTSSFIGVTYQTDSGFILAGRPNVINEMFGGDQEADEADEPLYLYIGGLGFKDWEEMSNLFGATGVIATDQQVLELGKVIKEEIQLPAEADWEPGYIMNKYETTMSIDEEGYLIIKGTFTRNNDFSTMILEYEGYAPISVDHMLDMTFSYTMRSKEPLSMEPVIIPAE